MLYGAHLVALECYRDICALGIGDRVIGFAVTDMEGNPSEIEGKPVRAIDAYVEFANNCLVIIAMPVKYHDSVERHARELGFNDFKPIPLEQMSEIKGERLISSYGGTLPYTVKKSSNDPTWLDLYADGLWGIIRCKYPTLFYLNEVEMIRLSADLYKKYCICLEHIADIKSLTDTGKKKEKNILNPKECFQIYMAIDKSVSVLSPELHIDPWVKPLHVGSRNEKSDYDKVFDDEWMDSLTDRNGFLAEMTGAYWIWKQSKKTEYKGLCHYRRHFVLSEDDVVLIHNASVDVILSTPRFVPGGMHKMFEVETPVKKEVFENLFSAIDDVALNDREEFERYIETPFYFPNNMVVAKSEIYDEYCAWIFPILLRMIEIDLETGYGHANDRHIAYAAELLTSYYFVKRKGELKIFFTDYKFYG